MRIALAFFWLCATAAADASQHRSREFNGVTAKFVILNPSLRPSELLNVAFSLHNGSDRPVDFHYLQLLQHIEVFTPRGKAAPPRLNAPSFESAFTNATLKPGETVRRVEKIDLSVWWDLDPGDYYLIFQYDLRLLPDSVVKAYQKRFHSNDRVIWDTKKYWFHVHR